MKEIGISHRPKRKPNGITKADKEAGKSDELIKRDFTAKKPLEKYITDITESKALNGKLYVSAIFDCFDLSVLGPAMDTNMKAALCEKTLENHTKHTRIFVEVFFILTEGHNIPANSIVKG